MSSLFITDRATVAGSHRTSDGYLAAMGRAARTGIQAYSGAEVGKPEMASVRVYRPESEVFDAASLSSLAHKPLTLGHPSNGVSADSWKRDAVGWTGGDVVRDGDTIKIPMMVADRDAIAAIEAGTRELSVGYTADIAWTPGTTPDGQAYDAVQRSIRGNHIALVAAGRAGPTCRFGDSRMAGTFLRDAAGTPITLYDRATGGRMKLTSDHIAAIEAEAAKAGMGVPAYVSDVLRYSTTLN